MLPRTIRSSFAAGVFFAVCSAAWTQASRQTGATAALSPPAATPQTAPAATSGPPPSAPASSATPAPSNQPGQNPAGQTAPAPSSNPSVAGGKLHGAVKSGNIPLPGVTVTAQNTLTGKRFSTTTDITGTWTLNIAQNGRYVIRTQFAAFAQGSQEAVLNATSHDQLVNFQLILASREVQQEQQQQAAARQGTAGQGTAGQDVRQLAGNAPENLSLMNTLSADTDTDSGTAGASGAALPSIASNSDFSDESVAVNGQAGQVSAFAGMDPNRLRDAAQSIQAQGGLAGQGAPGAQDGQGAFAGQGGLFGGFG